MKNKADIRLDPETHEVVVYNKSGKEVYREIKSEAALSRANTIYMYYKYGTED